MAEARGSAAPDAVRIAAARLRYERLPLIALAMAALLASLWAGLLRLGWNLPVLQPALYAGHGPLMVCGFLGTLIGLERAVALERGWCYAAPVLSAAGGLALIAGVADPIGPALVTLGSVGLVGDFALIVHRQAAWYTITMALGAIAWLVGNCAWLGGVPIARMFFWWTAFLVLTIVGERLELNRLNREAERKQAWLLGAVAPLVAGVVAAAWIPAAGLRLAGFGMVAMALWLGRYDFARRTAKETGLTRYIAVNLLAGYGWLGIGGCAWLWFGDDLTTFHYDLMLHAIYLGFVFSMIFAHAPIIFPSVLQRPFAYRRIFYLHSALLHLSLAVRAAGDLAGSYPAYRWGGLLNAAAILMFVVSTAGTIGLGIVRTARGRHGVAGVTAIGAPCDP
jgi:hypothetical protein